MAERRVIDQKFAVVSYAIGLCVSVLGSSIVAATVDINTNLFIYLSYLIPQIGYIGVFCINYFRYGQKFTDLLKKDNVKGVHYPLAIALAVGILFFALMPNFYLQKGIAMMGSNATTVVPTMDYWYDYVLCTLIICVLPAIGEELIFRKAFCDGMQEVSDVKTIFLCALAFSLSHLSLAQTVHQFFLGVILGFIYVATRNITLTMVMHFVNNLLALFLEKITGAEFWTDNVVLGASMAIGLVVAVGAIFGFIKTSKKVDNSKNGKLDTLTIILFAVLGLAWALTTALSFM